MTHYCALTADGNQPRLEARVRDDRQNEFVFSFVCATHLANPAGAHMRRMALRLIDAGHLSEVWTRRENGQDTSFTLDFTRVT